MVDTRRPENRRRRRLRKGVGSEVGVREGSPGRVRAPPLGSRLMASWGIVKAPGRGHGLINRMRYQRRAAVWLILSTNWPMKSMKSHMKPRCSIVVAVLEWSERYSRRPPPLT